MVCTTFLHDSELDVPLPRGEAQCLLDEVRKATGKNLQVVPQVVTLGKWPFKRKETWYGLYIYAGGIGPWQQINFFRDESPSSMNLVVPLELIVAFLYGTFVQKSDK